MKKERWALLFLAEHFGWRVVSEAVGNVVVVSAHANSGDIASAWVGDVDGRDVLGASMGVTGLAHVTLGFASLVLGVGVFSLSKGTDLHRAIGALYVFCMFALNLTALLIYRVFGGPGPVPRTPQDTRARNQPAVSYTNGSDARRCLSPRAAS